jgi:hypothetical protein
MTKNERETKTERKEERKKRAKKLKLNFSDAINVRF